MMAAHADSTVNQIQDGYFVINYFEDRVSVEELITTDPTRDCQGIANLHEQPICLNC